jgi:hypothetical protein
MKKTYTKKELESMSYVYDALIPTISKAAKTPSVFKEIMAEVQKFADANKDVLLTYIMGKQLLFNENTQNAIFEIIGINKDQVKKTIKESPYFASYGDIQLIEQLVFILPMVMLAGEYYKNKKDNEARLIYLLTFYKPYATRIFRYFGKYPVIEDRMAYTIENLSNRYDIKNEGTVQKLLIKLSSTSYERYIDEISKGLPDSMMYRIFASGIYGRVNQVIKNIYDMYKKNEGKYLPSDKIDIMLTDKDGASKEVEADIQSDAAIKMNITRRIIANIVKNPVEESIVDIAAKYGFIGIKRQVGTYAYSGLYTTILKNAVKEIIEKHLKDFPVFISAILSAFLYEINPATEKRYNAQELKTPIFLESSLRILKSPNIKNESALTVKRMLDEFLESSSTDYINFKDTQRRNLRIAFYFYILVLIQRS